MKERTEKNHKKTIVSDGEETFRRGPINKIKVKNAARSSKGSDGQRD